MYYEERVIDGWLHWRSAPDGEWIRKTAVQLTEMLVASRRAYRESNIRANALSVAADNAIRLLEAR